MSLNLNDTAQFTRSIKTRNRLVMPPMDTLMAKDGFANVFHIQHYGSKAYGGVGTIIVESTAVAPEGVIRHGDLGLWRDEQIEPLSKVVEVIKMGGAVAGLQINHAGAKSEDTSRQRYGATDYYSYIDLKTLKIVTPEDLQRITRNFIDTAKRAKKAGFQFVEVHAAHGYLLSELISPLTNQVIKSDDMAVRAKTVIDICKGIREEVPGIDVTIRFSVKDFEKGGNEPEMFAPLVKALEPYVDVFHISSGETVNHQGFDPKGPKLFRLPLGIAFRKLTKKPIIIGANFDTRSDIEKAFAENLDFVAMGRPLINNPNILLNTLLKVEELSEEKYPWNHNIWFSNVKYNTLMDQLGTRKKPI